MVLKASVKFFGDRENPAVQGCFSASAGPPPSLRPFIFVPLSLCNSVVGFFKPLLIALFIISATKTCLQHREGAVRGLTGTGLVFSWHQPRSETCCRGPRCERMMRYFTGFQTDLDRSRGPRVRSKKGNTCQDAKLPQWLAAVRHLQPPASPHPAPHLHCLTEDRPFLPLPPGGMLLPPKSKASPTSAWPRQGHATHLWILWAHTAHKHPPERWVQGRQPLVCTAQAPLTLCAVALGVQATHLLMTASDYKLDVIAVNED